MSWWISIGGEGIEMFDLVIGKKWEEKIEEIDCW